MSVYDFILKDENFSNTRKGKRQYLNERTQREFFRDVNSYFRAEVEVPRVRVGKRQEIESLIGEEAFQLARYLRGELPKWSPRMTEIPSKCTQTSLE